MPQDQRPPGADTLTLLRTGELDVLGRMPWSSNGTYLVAVAGRADADGPGLQAIYKPGTAERPLWDFPDGLYRREVAAYELARRLGWDLVPETVLRDGPLGPGSLQRFVDADFEQHYFTLLEDEAHHPALARMAVFDVLANNADRKGGHCLVDADGHLWGIDHGLCFHAAGKLRTVIWDFAGDPIDPALLADVDRLACDGAGRDLEGLLDGAEIAALLRRARRLADLGHLPVPSSDRPYPWPLV
ncbi:MAG TPA: SCO1664 family protein [Acidimicrobiales bacterium]|nr:SCO1664 family protein [Acidimicrobiales bacterium]